MLRLKIQIDREKSQKLMRGEPVAVKVPYGTRVVEFRLTVSAKDRNYIAEVMDTFFNGRPAR